MDKKVVFLDIDGTLMDFDGTIPKSTQIAINAARENGHHMVICTGRSFYQIQKEVLKLDFDGIIGGAGAFVICGEKEIFHSFIKRDKLKRLAEYLESNGFVYVAQADAGAIANKRCIGVMDEIYHGLGLDEERIKTLVGRYTIREDMWNYGRVEKLIFHRSPFPIEKVISDLSPDFYVTELSFQNNNDCSGEIGIGGINKSTGMQIYLEYINSAREDTIAIGDGPNDVEMISFANIGVAMGNAVPYLKEKADFVTKPINEDGIYYAFEKLQLI